MSLVPRDPLLAIARATVVILQVLLAVGALALVIALPCVLLFGESILAEVQVEGLAAGATFPAGLVAAIIGLALATVVLFWFFLRHLRRIIDTVGEGDPFVPANAERLTTMAWITLAIQLIALPMAGLVIAVEQVLQETSPSTETEIEFSGIVLVLVLFILARVFRVGARMREELEGTI